MKLPWVSRIDYDFEKNLRVQAQKELEEYKENENKEEQEWLIQLYHPDNKNLTELIVLKATHINTYGGFPTWDSVVVMNGNKQVGAFQHVLYYMVNTGED